MRLICSLIRAWAYLTRHAHAQDRNLFRTLLLMKEQEADDGGA